MQSSNSTSFEQSTQYFFNAMNCCAFVGTMKSGRKFAVDFVFDGPNLALGGFESSGREPFDGSSPVLANHARDELPLFNFCFTLSLASGYPLLPTLPSLSLSIHI
jgi:hypothetical protein